MNNYTKILKEKKYTGALIDDINLSINNLQSMNSDELEIISENINAIIGAMDDLKTSLAEQKAKNEPKKVVNSILEGYMKNTDGKSIERDVKENETIEKADNKQPVKEEVKKIEEMPNNVSNDITKKDVQAPEIIELAIELCKKYNVKIPGIYDGSIKALFNEGKISLDNFYITNLIYILDTFFTMKEVDVEDKNKIKEAISNYYQKEVLPKQTMKVRGPHYNPISFNNNDIGNEILKLLCRN